MKSSEAMKPVQLTHWNGRARQNLPYLLRRTTILRLPGTRHDKPILLSLVDTMSRYPQHLFIYTSENIEDLDIHVKNIVPILQVSRREDLKAKFDEFLSLDPPIAAVSIWAAETFIPLPSFEWVLISGNKYSNIKSTMSNMAAAGVPVYLERFNGSKLDIPAELKKFQTCTNFVRLLNECEKYHLCQNENFCS